MLQVRENIYQFTPTHYDIEAMNASEEEFGEERLRTAIQSRGLQSVITALAQHVSVRQPMECVVDQRHEPIERRLIAAAPRLKQPGRALS